MLIFGYGSLMWNPNFNYKSRKEYTLVGYERYFCIKSRDHRGCQKQFGLALGLIQKNNSVCKGIVFEIEDSEKDKVLKYLDERELNEDSYTKGFVKSEFGDILVYFSNPKSELYDESIPLDEQAKVISIAKGKSGKNIEYYINTIIALKKMGVRNENIYEIEKYLDFR